MTQAELITLTYKAMPYSEQIDNLELSQAGHIAFDWRGFRIDVDANMGVRLIEGGLVKSGDAVTILIESLIRRTYSMLPIKSE